MSKFSEEQRELDIQELMAMSYQDFKTMVSNVLVDLPKQLEEINSQIGNMLDRMTELENLSGKTES